MNLGLEVLDFETSTLLGATMGYTSDLPVLDGDDGDLAQVSGFDRAVLMIR